MTVERPTAHFIGIGGMGMRGLAEMLLDEGWAVSGSDREITDYLRRLITRGARIVEGQRAENIDRDYDVVVHSAAIKAGNVELAAARERGLPIRKYAQLLGQVMQQRRGVAISGTHGKTTTTAMIAWALDRAGKDPSFVVGADVPQLGSGSRSGGEILVAEACEYDRSFHNLRPEVAVITFVEEDHRDYYTGGIDEIVESFSHFAGLVPERGLLVACAEKAPNVLRVCRSIRCPLETYALDDPRPWTWTGETREISAGCYHIVVRRYGEFHCQIQLTAPGRHNALNALAATAVLSHFGVPPEQIAAALGAFRGAERRCQPIGEVNGVSIVDDYAHHPTEIRCTLEALSQHYRNRRLWCVFQPHQHSRTRFLLDDFARSFARATFVLVPRIYFVRDTQEERALVNSRMLVERIRDNGGQAEYLPEFTEIEDRLVRDVRPGDVIVTLGAGPIWKVARAVCDRLGMKRAG